MFKINGSKSYLITTMVCGDNDKGGYTFLTVQDELRDKQLYPDKMKIQVWKNLQDKIGKGDYIQILSAKEVAIVKKQDLKDKSKWFSNLTITCDPDGLVIDDKKTNAKSEPKTVKQQPTQMEAINVPDDELPF